MANTLDIGTLSGTIELKDNLSPEMALVIGKIDQLDGRLNNLSGNLSGNVAGSFLTVGAAKIGRAHV